MDKELGVDGARAHSEWEGNTLSCAEECGKEAVGLRVEVAFALP